MRIIKVKPISFQMIVSSQDQLMFQAIIIISLTIMIPTLLIVRIRDKNSQISQIGQIKSRNSLIRKGTKEAAIPLAEILHLYVIHVLRCIKLRINQDMLLLCNWEMLLMNLNNSMAIHPSLTLYIMICNNNWIRKKRKNSTPEHTF